MQSNTIRRSQVGDHDSAQTSSDRPKSIRKPSNTSKINTARMTGGTTNQDKKQSATTPVSTISLPAHGNKSSQHSPASVHYFRAITVLSSGKLLCMHEGTSECKSFEFLISTSEQRPYSHQPHIPRIDVPPEHHHFLGCDSPGHLPHHIKGLSRGFRLGRHLEVHHH